MEEITFQRLVELVCTRPQMFVGNGNFREAAAFLSGYDCAVGQLTGTGRDETDLGGFRAWLAARCWESHGIERNLGWDAYIRKLYPDDEMRFQQLLVLFNEYLQGREQSGATV